MSLGQAPPSPVASQEETSDNVSHCTFCFLMSLFNNSQISMIQYF